MEKKDKRRTNGAPIVIGNMALPRVVYRYAIAKITVHRVVVIDSLMHISCGIIKMTVFNPEIASSSKKSPTWPSSLRAVFGRFSLRGMLVVGASSIVAPVRVR
jgi:hypothetical protein